MSAIFHRDGGRKILPTNHFDGQIHPLARKWSRRWSGAPKNFLHRLMAREVERGLRRFRLTALRFVRVNTRRVYPDRVPLGRRQADSDCLPTSRANVPPKPVKKSSDSTGKQTTRVFFDLLVCSMNYNWTAKVFARECRMLRFCWKLIHIRTIHVFSIFCLHILGTREEITLKQN